MSGTDEELLQETNVGTDEDLFNSALAETPIEEPEPVVEEQPEQTEGQPRNEDGTFKAKEPEPEPAKDAPADDDRTGHIPAWRLKEEAEARRQALKEADEAKETARSLKAQLEDLQRRTAPERPAPQAEQEVEPDPILDPQGFSRHIERKLEQRFRQERGEQSMEMAREANPELFEKAFSEVTQAIQRGDRATQLRIYNSRNPGKEMIAWYREVDTQRKVGSDPEKWLEQELDKRLADPAYQAKVLERIRGGAKPATTSTARPAVDLPPSLSGATRDNGSRASDADDNDVSDEALFRQALR